MNKGLKVPAKVERLSAYVQIDTARGFAEGGVISWLTAAESGTSDFAQP
jgi:hypothetical protein